jgi:hypothetical protein
VSQLKAAIKSLHARKDRAYGDAWKRRGERISILPNIARKVDRLAVHLQTQAELRDEPILDTAIDLLVYCGKYLIFLGDLDRNLLAQLPIANPEYPLSDHVENLDQLLDHAHLDEQGTHTLSVLILDIEQTFETLWPLADAGSTPIERFVLASSLWQQTGQLIALISRDQPHAIDQFVQHEVAITKERAR